MPHLSINLLSAAVAAAVLALGTPALAAAPAGLAPPPPPPSAQQQLTQPPARQQLAQGKRRATLPPIMDRARLVPDGAEPRLAARVADLEARTGWAVRLLTAFPDDAGAPRAEDLRAGWALGPRSVAVLADPSAPNLLRFFPGEAVLADALPRRFFLELQARFGNMFERRKDGGDPEALGAALDALLACLEPGAGCGGAVPGLAPEQRALTALTSAAGGFVYGFATRVGAALPLAPLWAPLLLVYGLGPILTRLPPGVAALPAAVNVAAFIGAALLFRASPLFQRAGAARDSLTREGQARRMRSEDEETEE
jgi:hypothetical protein